MAVGRVPAVAAQAVRAEAVRKSRAHAGRRIRAAVIVGASSAGERRAAGHGQPAEGNTTAPCRVSRMQTPPLRHAAAWRRVCCGVGAVRFRLSRPREPGRPGGRAARQHRLRGAAAANGLAVHTCTAQARGAAAGGGADLRCGCARRQRPRQPAPPAAAAQRPLSSAAPAQQQSGAWQECRQGPEEVVGVSHRHTTPALSAGKVGEGLAGAACGAGRVLGLCWGGMHAGATRAEARAARGAGETCGGAGSRRRVTPPHTLSQAFAAVCPAPAPAGAPPCGCAARIAAAACAGGARRRCGAVGVRAGCVPAACCLRGRRQGLRPCSLISLLPLQLARCTCTCAHRGLCCWCCWRPLQSCSASLPPTTSARR